MDRAERVHEKNGILFSFCHSPYFLPELWSLKYQKLSDGSKKPVTVWAKCLSASEVSYLAFLENAMDY